jgi:hypothetical protein
MIAIGRTMLRISITHFPRVFALAIAVCSMLATPARAFAQTDKWEVNVAPLYLWAATTSGHVAVNNKGVPIYMAFDDAVDKLSGAFTLHVDARKGRWGLLSDFTYMQLSTDTSFTTPVVPRSVAGTGVFSTVIFEGGVSYQVKPRTTFNLIGGLRTYTMSGTLNFAGTVAQLTPVDTSATVAGVFGGFTFRPKLADKVTLISRADIGGGQALTWSSALGVEFRFKPWVGAMVGYKALGVDTGSVPTSGTSVVKDVGYDVTQYGPIFSLTFHWTQK